MPLSYIDYTGDGSNRDFNVTFPYLSKSHVHVYVNGTETTAFVWQSSTQVRLNVAPPNTSLVRLKRTTPREARLVDFQNGTTLDANADLDQDSNQLFYISQETIDSAGSGAGAGDDAIDGYTGNGTNTIYVLTSAPDTNQTMTVLVNGVAQVEGVDYTVVGQNIVFTSPPAPGATITITYVTIEDDEDGGGSSVTFDGAITYDIFTGNGATTGYTLKTPPGNLAAMDVAINGVVKTPGTDYLLTGQVITFTAAPANGATILVRYAATLPATAVNVIQEVRTATENQTVFLLTSTYQPGTQTMMVYQNGLRLTPGIDYTETDTATVTLLGNTDAGDILLFVYGNPINGETIDGSRLIDETVPGSKLEDASIDLDKLSASLQSTLSSATRLTGEVMPFTRTSAPTGWIKANGGTIGNASSGGTLRANSDTEALFTLLWNEFSNTVLPIQTSGGIASTRGASAAIDYAANKRLPVLDLRGEFVRGWDDSRGVDAGRAVGSAQLDEVKAHTHPVPVNPTNSGSNGYPLGDGTSQGAYGAVTGSTGGTETRPRNVALLYCIKL